MFEDGFMAELFIFRTRGWCQSPGTAGCEGSVNRAESEDLRRGLAQQNLWAETPHPDQDWDRCDTNKSSNSTLFFFSWYFKISLKFFLQRIIRYCLHTYLFRAPKEAWNHSTKDSTYDGPCQQHDQASLQKEHFLSHFISTLF